MTVGTGPFSLYRQRDEFASVSNQNIQFPTDLSDAYIQMRFEKYERRSINQQPFLFPGDTIRLPIPGKLVDSTDLDYSSETLGPAYGAAAEGLTAVGSNPLGGLGATIGGVVGGVLTNLVQNATTDQQRSALSTVTGLAVNQFQTMTFKSPTFKNHSFSWKLVPKNKDESNLIENIIRLFKYHSLPALSDTAAGGVGLFFGYPEMLRIKLFTGNKDQYLYKFKPCVVRNVSVNYAPNGPSFYRDTRAPTAVELSVNLTEIELWTKADYLRDDAGIPQAIAAASNSLRVAGS